MQFTHKIAPCLWFDHEAEQAARFYVSVFSNSKINTIAGYGKAGYEIHRKTAGTVMTVAFELDGQPFTALNGGPAFKFNEAISLQVYCKTQEEVDYYWSKLSAGRRRTCAAVRLAQGQIRRIVAGRADRFVGPADRSGITRQLNARWKRC